MQQRLKQLYTNKLDNQVGAEEYAAHQRADHRYVERGIQLLELAQFAYQTYLQGTDAERHRYGAMLELL